MFWRKKHSASNPATSALDTWSIKYYETRAIAERALFDIRTAKSARPGALFGQFSLAPLFGVLNYFMEKLLSRLTTLETQPSSWFLLQGEGAKIPQSLRELFYITVDVLQCARDEGLTKSFMLGRHFARLGELSHRLYGFANRFEDAQQKLRSRMSPEEAEEYREAEGGRQSQDHFWHNILD
jgi:hypothetical protein